MNQAQRPSQPVLRMVKNEPQPADTLYTAREKIHPREIKGKFQNLRKLAAWVILGGFYGLAWIPWGNRQILLFDLPARRFHILWMTFYPQDFIYLALLLVMAAVSLLFFTALGGRLWCGYTCPQTLWTELFLWVERITEGDRAKRIKLDKSPWNRDKILRKGTKQLLWVSLALWTGFTFVGYFTPIRTLGNELLHMNLGSWETFWILFYGFATYGNAGFLREQVCLYMCPYARFQGAMFDRDTLIITYDQARGEPRGGRPRSVDPRSKGLGDCIDCTLCVQVCPTGIDIRDGLQYACIACGSCVDACNSVMDKMGYPRGLVRYTTENALEGKPTHILRPRVILYAMILLVMGSTVAYSILTRPPLALDILHDRNALYRVLDDGRIENSYTLKISNRSEHPQRYRVSAAGIADIHAETDPAIISVAPQAIATVPARVDAPADELHGGSNITLTLQELNGDAHVVEVTRFLAPR